VSMITEVTSEEKLQSFRSAWSIPFLFPETLPNLVTDVLHFSADSIAGLFPTGGREQHSDTDAQTQSSCKGTNGVRSVILFAINQLPAAVAQV